LQDDLSLSGLAISGGVCRLDGDKVSLSGHIEDSEGAALGVGEVGGSRRAELGTELVLEGLVHVRELGTVELHEGGVVVGIAQSAARRVADAGNLRNPAKDDLGLSFGGDGIIVGVAQSATRRVADAGDLRHCDGRAGLESLDRVSVRAVDFVVGSNCALSNNLEIFFTGSMEEALNDHAALGGMSSSGLGSSEEFVGSSAQAEIGGRDRSGEHGKDDGVELHGGRLKGSCCKG